jgi:hypothetical protein
MDSLKVRKFLDSLFGKIQSGDFNKSRSRDDGGRSPQKIDIRLDLEKFSMLPPPKFTGACICGCSGKKLNFSRDTHIDINAYKQCPARLARKENEKLRRAYNAEKKRKLSWGKREKIGAEATSKAEANFRQLPTFIGTKCKVCATNVKTKHGYCKKCKLAENKLRDAMKRGAYPEDLSHLERAEILNIYEKAQEVSRQTGIQHHVDHIRPLARGGRHHPSNLQIITAERNLKKGARWSEDE